MLYGYTNQFIQGLIVTLKLASISLVLGVFWGVIFALFKRSKYKALYCFSSLFTTVIRGLPELMVLFAIYFGSTIILSKLFGHYVDVNSFMAGVVALSLIFSAYFAEVLDSAYMMIQASQLIAADAYGFSTIQKIRWIILPQLFRYALPGFSNLCLILLKDTAIVSLIGVSDLMQAAHVASSALAQPFTFYVVVAFIYLGLTSLLSLGFMRLNKYWGW